MKIQCSCGEIISISRKPWECGSFHVECSCKKRIKARLLVDDIPEKDIGDGFAQTSMIIIGSDGLCSCNTSDRCPLGKAGSELRCTVEELSSRNITWERKE